MLLIKSFDHIKSFLLVWLVFSFLYGGHLYFYGNIDNPNASYLFSILKDFVWFVFLILVLLFYAHNGGVFRFGFVKAFCVILPVYLFVSVLVGLGFDVQLSYIVLLKNLFIYGVGALFVFGYLAYNGFADWLVKVLVYALLISVAVSLLLVFSPVQSYTGRLFGTYGNPNSFGFAVCVLFLLLAVAIRKNQFNFLFFSLACGLSVVALILTASIGSVLGLIAFLLVYLCYRPHWSRYSLVFALVLVVLGFNYILKPFAMHIGPTAGNSQQAVVDSSAPVVEESASDEMAISDIRFRSIIAQGADNDALRIRINDLVKMLSMACPDPSWDNYVFGCLDDRGYTRMDSTLMSFLYNFGYIIPLAFFIVLFSVVIFYLYRIFQGTVNSITVPFIVFCLTVVPINLILQHSFEIFPTILLYQAIVALLLYHSAEA